MSKRRIASGLFFFLLFLAGCAAGPEVKNFPRRELDRPYTLPKGVAAWKTPIYFGRIKDSTRSTTIPPIPAPLLWTTSLSDSWDLLWFPFPLGVAHQIYKDSGSRLGTMLTTGLSYSDVEGFKLLPILSVEYRLMLDGETALVFVPLFAPEIAFESGPFRWSTGLSVGPLFEVNPNFWVKPALGISLGRGKVALGAAFAETQLSNTTVTSFSPGFAFGWSLSQQWELIGNYDYYAGGNGLQVHIGNLQFNHYW